MPLMKWSESYSVGNPILDSDHKILVSLINQLHEALDTGQSRDVLTSIVNVLVEYAEHHFRREEALLARAAFPDLPPHLEEHRDLLSHLHLLRDRVCAGEKSALGEEAVDFLKKWLTDHILVSDKSYKPWVRGLSEGEGRNSDRLGNIKGIYS